MDWESFSRENSLELKPYDREKAVKYARTWALSRNPNYMDYEKYGGDCTNFISQCLHAGNIPFDEQGKDVLMKWYWYSDRLRTPSWTGVNPLRTYLLNNNRAGTQNFGVFSTLCNYEDLIPGDLVQKSINGALTHTMMVSEKLYDHRGKIKDYLVCQHTYDLLDFPLSQKDGVLSYIKIHGYYT